MPNDVVERRKRCVEWMNRASPPCSPHASDDELDNDAVDYVSAEEDAPAMRIVGLEEAETEEVMQFIDKYGEMEESPV